tara:strand:+ start:997 stop:1647 length:651 start_codon:yes stop_codon:yes gene_type:complete
MMKMKVKILKESRYKGLYEVTGIQPGSIDLFIKHFVDIDMDVQMSRREFFSSTFGDQIESLTDSDIPRTSARGYGSALDKVKVALRSGTSHWYNQVFGSEMADFVIEAKVLMYLTELAEGLEKIGYESISADEFNRLPQSDKNLVFEKHFLEDYLDSFINDHVKMDSMNTTGFLDNPGVGAGLYGQMKDWYMSTAGADVLKEKIRELLSMLPQRTA